MIQGPSVGYQAMLHGKEVSLPLRSITIPPGIGDGIWLIQKLINAKEQFNFRVPSGLPKRGKQLYDLLPQIGTSEYIEPVRYKDINEYNLQRTRKHWYSIKVPDFYLSANEWLETGNYLKDWFPDLPISYRIEYATSQADKNKAKELLREKNKAYIGIYTSAYSTMRNWGFWDENKWLELIKLLYQPGMSFVIIGAAWDTDLATKLMDLMKKEKLPFINTIGTPLSTVIEIQRLLKYAFYFPSGLPVLSETAGGSDCCMFYPSHLRKMQNKYADPARIESNGFKEAQFCEPVVIFKWVKEVYKLYERL